MYKRISGFLSLILGLSLVVMSFIPASASGMQTIWAKALNDHECNDSEWHFVITQVSEESLAPGSINVSWANGAGETVPLDKFTGGTAHYSTSSNLGSTVTSASAEIYSEWSGQFNLSHGPCNSNATPTIVIPTNTPTEVVVTLSPTPETPTASPTPEVTITLTVTASPTGEITVTSSPTPSETPTPTLVVSVTPTPTGTVVTVTSSPTATPTKIILTGTPTPTTPAGTATPTNPPPTVTPTTPAGTITPTSTQVIVTATPTTPSTQVTLTPTNTPKPPQTGFIEDAASGLGWLRWPGLGFSVLGIALMWKKKDESVLSV